MICAVAVDSMSATPRSDHRRASVPGGVVAWGAGAAFLGSLSYFVFFYVVLLGRDSGHRLPLSRSLALDMMRLVPGIY